MKVSKSDILSSIKTGENSQALAFLYKTTLYKVRTYVLRNKGTLEEANDIFQDSVIIFFNQVKNDRFDEKKDIDGFIYFVARNLWISKMRKEKRIIHVEQSELQDSVHQDDSDSLSSLISKEKASAMKMVFDKLDEKCKKILQYVLHDKLTLKEVSIKMGYSSEDVAKTNHYRCKQYLTKIIKEDAAIFSLLKP